MSLRRRLSAAVALTVAAAGVVMAAGTAAAATRHEAESAPATCDGLIESNHAGFSGSGFCNANNAAGAAAQFTVTAPAAGAATVNIRYANGGTSSRPADVLVNGAVAHAGSAFDPTGAWTSWVTKTLTVSLNAGDNTIRLNPTTAGGLPNLDYLEVDAPTSGKTTVWLAGDSTVANSSGSNVVGWGRELSNYLTTDATVVNSAVGGRSVQTWLYESAVTSTKNSAGECVLSSTAYAARWQAMLNASTGMKAGDHLFIQFGINDGSSTCPRHVGSARYRELLTTMVRAAQQRGAHPVLVTPVSALRCSGSTATPTRGFLTETFDVGRATGAPVIDLHKLSYTLYNSLRFCPFNGDYSSGPVGAFFANDHTHFEAAGARQIAGLVTKAVRDQQLALSAYLR
ncbi:lysophospholipase L1-like esterase [Nonomuraea polychroma]|uniref:Lysophospholipase L1-like esterase n=1 Tax=Nonomuraea polychroma TaxID=46176 RepID=A0A438MEB2_9ACTN|nr:SGNH/GDSL hydrolase family protein [Nonomuraea polychroma]RVX43885.1 lysophospholipase L1-like esterase [Nonomuraea polychroma]